MTEISEAAKAKAWTLCTEHGLAWSERDFHAHVIGRAFARFIQQVSDAWFKADGLYALPLPEHERKVRIADLAAPFILPEPMDPLRAALREIPDEDIRSISATYDVGACRERIADALAKRGLKIVEEALFLPTETKDEAP